LARMGLTHAAHPKHKKMLGDLLILHSIGYNYSDFHFFYQCELGKVYVNKGQ